MNKTQRSIPHGTLGGYTHHGCRCDECRRARRDYGRESTRQAYAAPLPPWAVHGSASTYNNYGCRCGPCRSAVAAYQRRRRAS